MTTTPSSIPLLSLINNQTTTSTTTQQTTTSSISPRSSGVTSSIFPPFPTDIPYSSTCFSFSVFCDIPIANLLTRGFSKKLAVFNRILVQHVKSMSMSPHDDMKAVPVLSSQTQAQATSFSSSSFSRSDYSSSSIAFVSRIKPDDIKKIFIVKPKQTTQNNNSNNNNNNMTSTTTSQTQQQQQTKTQRQRYTNNTTPTYIFYVYCSNESATERIRNLIQQHTTLTPQSTRVRYVIGRVSSIHYNTSTNDVMMHIRAHDPRITSVVITRILESFPSSHFRSSAYFYIRSDELGYLRDLSPLPGHKECLKWEKYIPPAVHMCSLCYDTDHVRSKCQHRDKIKYFCANCKAPNHYAKQCQQLTGKPTKCLICDSSQHTVVQCSSFRPTYIAIPLAPSFSQFPALAAPRSLSAPVASSSPLGSRDDSSSPPHKRVRHISFDSDSQFNYSTRNNHAPLSPPLQQYLNESSLTRSPSSSSSRSGTPSPSRSRSGSSYSSSSSSKDTVKFLQETITQQQQLILQLQQELKQLKQQQQQQPTTTTTTSATQHHDVMHE